MRFLSKMSPTASTVLSMRIIMNGDGSRVYYFHAKEQDLLRYVFYLFFILNTVEHW